MECVLASETGAEFIVGNVFSLTMCPVLLVTTFHALLGALIMLLFSLFLPAGGGLAPAVVLVRTGLCLFVTCVARFGGLVLVLIFVFVLGFFFLRLAGS